jgi:cytochrome c556
VNRNEQNDTPYIGCSCRGCRGHGIGDCHLAAIAKQEQQFDVDVVQASATKIADHLTKAETLFPEGSEQGDVQTWAKPEIWNDRGNFDELMKSAHQAAVELQSVTDAKAFPPALGKLGNSCKSCHDMYRLPKQ